MPRLQQVLDALNGAAGAGPGGLDGPTLVVLRALMAETLLLAVLLGVAVYLALRALRRRPSLLSRLPAPAEDPCAAIQARLDQMVAKTNERNNYINSIFASIEDGIMLVDSSGRIVLYNPRAEALLGLGPYVFFDSARPEERHSPEVRSVLEACAGVKRTGTAERRELVTAQGRVIDARVLPVVDKYRGGAGFGSLAVVKDVTEIRKLEALRKDFVATVSHEFRTPLTLISGFLEMLRTREDLPGADRRRAFEIMDIETERLKRLVSELLTLSEIEASLPGIEEGEIDPGEVVRKTASSLSPLAEARGQELRVELAPDLGRLRGNEAWLHLAVRNLVENAIKYTQDGGRIGIRAWREGGTVGIAVSDTGIGIAGSELERIFERFYRVEKSRGSGAGGSGLGLSLVKDIAAIFGGRVEVESEPGKGSVFTMRLPARGQGKQTEEA